VWSVIKKNVRPQKLGGAGADWQTLLDDTWREVMDEVKRKQAAEVGPARYFYVIDSRTKSMQLVVTQTF